MKDEISGCLCKKAGRYFVRIYFYENRQRREKSFPTGLKVENGSDRKNTQAKNNAHLMLANILSSFKANRMHGTPDKRNQLFADAASEWLERQTSHKAESTIAGYRYALADIILYFTEVNCVRTVDLTSRMVEDYFSWERMRRQPDYSGPHKKKNKYSDGTGIENTILHRATIIRAVLQYCKRDGIVEKNVASKRDSWVELPQPQQHVFQVFTPEEADEFVEALKGEPLWFRVAVLLALMLGLRRSEVIGLRVSDIDFKAHELVIQCVVTQQAGEDRGKKLTVKTKTKSTTTKCLEIWDELLTCIEAMIEGNRKNEELFGEDYDHAWKGFLFRDVDGKLIQPDTLTKTFSKFVERIGCKKLRFHDLRHSCASILHANGYSIKTVQEILGHKQLTTTIMYTHAYEKEKKQAMNYMQSRYAMTNQLSDAEKQTNQTN